MENSLQLYLPLDLTLRTFIGAGGNEQLDNVIGAVKRGESYGEIAHIAFPPKLHDRQTCPPPTGGQVFLFLFPVFCFLDMPPPDGA